MKRTTVISGDLKTKISMNSNKKIKINNNFELNKSNIEIMELDET